MHTFFSGALAMGTVVAALFFWRFWHLTRDRLFAYFAVSFLLLALHWGALGLVPPSLEPQHALYLVRLAAFLLLIVGIVEKNRRS